MSVETVVQLINDGLRDVGCNMRVTGRGGGWVSPSHIILDAYGKQHYLQFWDGQNAEGELKTAKAIFEDVQGILTQPREVVVEPNRNAPTTQAQTPSRRQG